MTPPTLNEVSNVDVQEHEAWSMRLRGFGLHGTAAPAAEPSRTQRPAPLRAAPIVGVLPPHRTPSSRRCPAGRGRAAPTDGQTRPCVEVTLFGE